MGDDYGGWCYGERLNGPCFWPEFSGHYVREGRATKGLNSIFWTLFPAKSLILKGEEATF
jgi:hypothetical protein